MQRPISYKPCSAIKQAMSLLQHYNIMVLNCSLLTHGQGWLWQPKVPGFRCLHSASREWKKPCPKNAKRKNAKTLAPQSVAHGPSTPAPPVSLLEMQSCLHPRPTESECEFDKISRWFLCTVKFEKHCPRLQMTTKAFHSRSTALTARWVTSKLRK